MNRNSRLVILYAILAVCILNASVAIFTGNQPPEALYGVLGTIGAYALVSGKDDNDDDDEPPRRKRKRPVNASRGADPEDELE